MQISIRGGVINCEQPKYSSVVGWVNKCWYGLKTERFRVVEGNELWLPGTASVSLPNIMLGKKKKSPFDYDPTFIKK